MFKFFFIIISNSNYCRSRCAYHRQETTRLPIFVKSGNTDIIFPIRFNNCFHCKYHLNHKKNTLGDAAGIRGFRRITLRGLRWFTRRWREGGSEDLSPPLHHGERCAPREEGLPHGGPHGAPHVPSCACPTPTPTSSCPLSDGPASGNTSFTPNDIKIKERPPTSSMGNEGPHP